MTTRKTRVSKQFSLSWIDYLKGAVVSALTSSLVVVQASLNAGEFVFNWKLIAMTALGGFIGYLLKNFFEPTKIITEEKIKKG